MDISQLIAEAEAALREGDPLAVDANASYIECKLLVEQSTVLWARILFLHAAQQDQLQSMGHLYVIVHNSLKQASSECDTSISRMHQARADLRGLLVKLKQISVDPAFRGSATLHSYVHMEDIQSLDQQVDKLVDELRRQLKRIESIPESLQKALTDLRAKTPNLPDTLYKVLPRKMAKLTTKSEPYAHDAAEQLEGLTRNYDLCVQILSLSDPTEKDEALAVVTADRPQVANALSRLKECRSALRSRHRESQRLQMGLAETFERLLSYGASIGEFLSQDLKADLSALVTRNDEFTALNSRVDSIVAELTGLTEYYRLFLKSYHALVIEAARRLEAQKQFQKVIDNANAALRGFVKREAETRQSFLDTYSEFLPPELWPEMVKMPAEYEVQLEAEPVPAVSKEQINKALSEQ